MTTLRITKRITELTAIADGTSTSDQMARSVGTRSWPAWSEYFAALELGLIESRALGPKGGQRIMRTSLGQKLIDNRGKIDWHGPSVGYLDLSE